MSVNPSITCPRCRGQLVSTDQNVCTCQECDFRFFPSAQSVLLLEGPNGEAIHLPVECVQTKDEPGGIRLVGYAGSLPLDGKDAADVADEIANSTPIYLSSMTPAPAPRPKGKPGRRGYSRKALAYARRLREQNPDMKAHVIRMKCLKRFQPEDMPPTTDAFRAWLNRDHKD